MTARITLETRAHVLLIGINRPEKRNAFDVEALEQLADAYEHLALDPDLRVAVLFAHGDHFSAGLDLADVTPSLRKHGAAALCGGSRFDPFGVWGERVTKPIVAAVQGIAYTLSIELALAADIVVVADDVQFRQMEVARGIVPFGGATFRAPAQLGWGNAMRYLLTAETFGAEEALRIGLVQEVVSRQRLLPRALELAERVAAQAPLGVQATLANARAHRAANETAAAKHLRVTLPEILSSDDAAEGLASFVERREANFRGT